VIKGIFDTNFLVIVPLLTVYMAVTRDYMRSTTGLVFLPAVASMGLTLGLGARYGTRANRKFRLIVGLAIMAAGTWLLSGLDLFTDKRWLAAAVPQGPWLYPDDQIADAPSRSLAAEITREKLYLRLHQELPYQSTVETDSWTERPDGSVRIEQTIYVERESQRKIVLGKGGATIKAIGAAARKEIAVLIEQPVHLFLFVKVREGWSEDPERYREMGLEFPKD